MKYAGKILIWHNRKLRHWEIVTCPLSHWLMEALELCSWPWASFHSLGDVHCPRDLRRYTNGGLMPYVLIEIIKGCKSNSLVKYFLVYLDNCFVVTTWKVFRIFKFLVVLTRWLGSAWRYTQAGTRVLLLFSPCFQLSPILRGPSCSRRRTIQPPHLSSVLTFLKQLLLGTRVLIIQNVV